MPDLWKLSHPASRFTADERAALLDARLAVLRPRAADARQARDFRQAPPGGLFVLCHGRRVLLLGRFVSPAETSRDGEGPPGLQRPYEVVRPVLPGAAPADDDPMAPWMPRGTAAFHRVPNDALPTFERTVLGPCFGLTLRELDALPPPTLAPDALPAPEAPPVDPGPLNRILVGPPGTGKTWRAVAEAVALADGVPVESLLAPDAYAAAKARFDALRAGGRIEFVTFHPSFTYQDFVEGVKPRTTAAGGLVYVVEPGVLKRIAERARDAWEATQPSAGPPLTDDDRFDRAFGRLLADLETPDLGPVKARLFRGGEIELGAGVRERSLTARRPGRPAVALSGHRLRALWRRRHGIAAPGDTGLYEGSLFWAVLRLLEATDAVLGPPAPGSAPSAPARHVLVLDEINRAPVGKVFGELITLIEDDKRLGAPNALTARLPASPDARPFGLPPNLYLIGTMNTADRSVAPIDVALRRRFSFVELRPDASVLAAGAVPGVDLARLLTVLNDRIELLTDRDHVLGHAYFHGVASIDALAARLRDKVIPLLNEYFHDDGTRLRLVFGDGPAKPEALHVVRETVFDPARLFGAAGADLDPRVRHAVAETLTAEMVRAIYEE